MHIDHLVRHHLCPWSPYIPRFHKSLIQRRFSQPGYIRIISFMVMNCCWKYSLRTLCQIAHPLILKLSFCIVLKGNTWMSHGTIKTWGNKIINHCGFEYLHMTPSARLLRTKFKVQFDLSEQNTAANLSNLEMDTHFSFTPKAADWKFQAFPTQNIPLRHLG